jgi:vacuole morphology and inheritance protein 14
MKSRTYAFMLNSADLEITVPMLVQVDKLVQLIESPVFTCKSSVYLADGHAC